MLLSAYGTPFVVRTDDTLIGPGPGLVAFLIVAALGVAVFLLVRSMLNQIKKVPPTFDDPDETADEDPTNEEAAKDGEEPPEPEPESEHL